MQEEAKAKAEAQLYYVVNQLGRYGREIVFALASLSLYKTGQNAALGYYLIGAAITMVLNIALKIIIKQPRPKHDKPDFNFVIENSESERKRYDKYGMPSGHAQIMCYTLVFVAYALWGRRYYWLIMATLSLLTINTLMKRVLDNNHSVSQIAAGSMVGSLIGVTMYYMVKSKLKGSMKAKEDDNALFIP
jgi:membrane-associated phospholipid phosphatase